MGVVQGGTHDQVFPGYWKGIGKVFEGVLAGYWWVLRGIGTLLRRRASVDGGRAGVRFE